MGCCVSSSRKIRVSPAIDLTIYDKYYSRVVNNLFRFEIINKEILYNKLKSLKNTQINENFSYDFSIDDYNEISALIFTIESYTRKHSNNDYNISYTVNQTCKNRSKNDKSYLFLIHVQFMGCTAIQLCESLLILLDLIPHKFFTMKFPKFSEACVEDIKEIRSKLIMRSVVNYQNYDDSNFSEKLLCKNIIFDSYMETNRQYGSFDANKMSDYKQNECIICLERVRDQLLRPCNHYAVCEKCRKSIRTCPICRASITDSISVINV